MAQLVVDVLGPGHGVADLFAQELAVALAETVQGDPDGGFGETETGGYRHVRSLDGPAAEAGRERVEVFGAAGGGLFGAEPVGDGPEQGQRPGTIKGAIGREPGVGGAGQGGGVGVGVERRTKVRAAFQRAVVVAPVGQMMFETRQKPGAETSAFASDGGERLGPEQAGEKTLHRVLGVGRREAATQGVGEEGRTVLGAESGESAAGRGRIGFPLTGGVEDQRPAGGGEGGAHGAGASKASSAASFW